jgi:hypothetical protein
MCGGVVKSGSMAEASENWTEVVESGGEKGTVFSRPLSDRELKMGVE